MGPLFDKTNNIIGGYPEKGVRCISGIRGRQSVTEARVCLKLDLLETRRKTARMNFMMQILTNQKHDALIQCFQKLQDFNHSFNTRSIANREPLALTCNTGFYQHSFMPRTSRNLRGKP